MQYEVILKLHEDDANGQWGLSPIDTISSDTSFNAFWGADGIFHDVFEHWQEGVLPYYSGKGFMTLWGEMFASGAALAYHNLGINNFRYRSGRTDRDFCRDTWAILQDSIYNVVVNHDEYYAEYSSLQETCLTPYQKLPYSYDLESTINEYHYRLETYCKENETKANKFIWKPGIARNYSYGWKQAQKIIGKDRQHSYEVLDRFLAEWHRITQYDPKNIYIDDEFAAHIKAFKFVVKNTKKLKVTTTIIDEFNNSYSLNQLITN